MGFDRQAFLWRLLVDEASLDELGQEFGLRRGALLSRIATVLGGRAGAAPGRHVRRGELFLYLTGRRELGGKRRRAMAAHLERCAPCRQRRRSVRDVMTARRGELTRPAVDPHSATV